MPVSSIPALVLSALLVLPAAAAPKPQKECPHGFSEREEIVASIGKAGTCTAALGIAQACAGGASGDTELGEMVVERCERDFAGKLSPQQKRAYDAEHKVCDRRYAKKEGTMYISFIAFCHAEVAHKYARRYLTRR